MEEEPSTRSVITGSVIIGSVTIGSVAIGSVTTGSVTTGSVTVGGSVVPRMGQVGGLVGISDPLLASRYWSTESVT